MRIARHFVFRPGGLLALLPLAACGVSDDAAQTADSPAPSAEASTEARASEEPSPTPTCAELSAQEALDQWGPEVPPFVFGAGTEWE